MAKGLGLIGYLMVGLKLIIVSIATSLTLLVPAVLLGITVFSIDFLTEGVLGRVGSGGLWLLFVIAGIIVSGFWAFKLWKWK